MANLSVTIGGDASEFNREISRVEDTLRRLQTQRDVEISLGLDTTALDRRIASTTERLNRLRTTLGQTGQSMQSFNRNAANGSNTLTQFSRIAQDAPFGIIGIGNNLTATAEAFSNLSRSAGGAGGALRAVGQSLMGGGGILLAISLVTTGLTYMAQKGLTVSDVFNKLVGNFDEARRSMQDLNAQSAKNAQAEISSLGAYVSVAKNVKLSMEERLIAVKKLQDEYPAYFGNLTKEQILNGNVAGAVKEVTRALIAKAKASAMVEKIVALAEEEEKIQSRINNSIVATAKAYKLNNKEAFELARLLNAAARSGEKWSEAIGGTAFDRLSKYTVLQQIAILRTLDGFNDLGAELRSNLAQQDKLTKGIEQQTAAQIKLDFVKEKAAKKTYDTPQVDGVQNFITTSGLKDLNTIETFNGKVDQFKNKLKGLPGEISTSLKNITNSFSTETAKMNAILDKFNTDMNKIIEGGIVQTLAGLSESIGEAFASGGNVIATVGKSLLSTLGGVLVELGKMAITTGVGILAIQTSLKSLNPYVAIAAGAALIALGGAVKGSVKNLGGSMSSAGSSSGLTSNLSTGASYSSPASASSFANTGSSSSNSGTVVFEISGQSLIGVLSNTLDANTRLGGTLGL